MDIRFSLLAALILSFVSGCYADYSSTSLTEPVGAAASPDLSARPVRIKVGTAVSVIPRAFDEDGEAHEVGDDRSVRLQADESSRVVVRPGAHGRFVLVGRALGAGSIHVYVGGKLVEEIPAEVVPQ